MTRRDLMTIYESILKVCSEGLPITWIMYDVRLSHRSVVARVKELMDMHYLTYIDQDVRYNCKGCYHTTQKGMWYLGIVQKLKNKKN